MSAPPTTDPMLQKIADALDQIRSEEFDYEVLRAASDVLGEDMLTTWRPSLSYLPPEIEWIDGPERVGRLLPRVCEMVPSGTITVEDVEIATYTHRPPHALPPDSVGQVMTREVVTVHPETP